MEDFELKWKSLVNWESPKYSFGVLAYTSIIFVYGKYISESTALSFAFQVLFATYILIGTCRFAFNEGKAIEEENDENTIKEKKKSSPRSDVSKMLENIKNWINAL